MKNFYISAVQPYSIKISGTIKSMVAESKIKTESLRTGMTVISILVLLFLSNISQAQNCPTSGTHTQSAVENTYYPATSASLSVGATSITLGAAGTGGSFGASPTPIATGDIVLVIQMQGAVINVPASVNASTYGGNASGKGSGFLSTSLMAGNMEFAVATNSVPLAGGTLNISAGLTYAYQSSAYTATQGQYTYQVIRVPTFYNIQLTSGITTPSWNGKIGGVLIINAIFQLDLNGQTVSAVGAGFRGGGGVTKGGGTGAMTNYYTLASNNANGSKGEGIAGTPEYINNNFILQDNVVEGYPSGSFAMGAPANAGGGATDSDPPSNSENAGGGGGGNGGAGGRGGNGWKVVGVSGGFGGSAFKTTSPSAGTYYSPSRLIMGGGGGAGDTNNSTGTKGALSSSGAAGGGIIIINTTNIINAGTINVSGSTFDYTVLNDGSGGGGGGGSLLVYANSGQSGITAIANGGDGVSNYPASASATQHGPGGGGGGGVVMSNAALNVASSVTAGAAGISHGSTVTDNFGAVAGSVGILTQTFPFSQLPPNMQICQTIVLPVKMLSFTATLESAQLAKITWSTTNEVNANYFVVERSSNGTSFDGVAQVFADNSISQVHSYSINDPLSNVTSEIVYYRIRIVDLSGKSTFTNVVPLKLDQPASALSVYPNPVDGYTTLSIYSEKQTSGMYRLIDNSGKQILTKSFNAYKGTNSITVDNLGSLSRGIYYLQIMLDNKLYNQKIVKR